MKILITLGFIIAGIILIIAGITAFLGPDDMTRCEERPSNSTNCAVADAIVAVSGGDTNARTDAAIKLYQQGWAPILIFSGAAQDTEGPSNAQSMKARAVEQGVLEANIIIEEFARNTAENAANTSQFINDRNVRSVILVTSGYHQRRANLEFGARLGSSIQIVNAPAATDSQWDRWWWLHPRGWWLAGGELAKIIAYYASGGAT